MFDDTIIAISTPPGYGGLGVVRLSGVKALEIAKIMFHPHKINVKIHPRLSTLGHLYDFENKHLLDEAYLTYFPGPKSYTTEDLVEISCHGSPVILEEIVRLGILAGARHANPGEFTLRAFLGGRIDILQAEAVNDLIRSSSLKQAKISFRQLEGSLSKKIKTLRRQIVRIVSQTEASLEFPDEDFHISSRTISNSLGKAIETVKKLVTSYDLGQTLSQGLTIAIIGKTNVGKSTLFNALLEKARAIITPFPGTTRDYLREQFKIKDSVFSLIDMAGLSNTINPIEIEGIKRSKKMAETASGIILILDGSRPETQEDIAMIQKYRKKRTLLLFNKIDLPIKMNIRKIKRLSNDLPHLEISALKKINLGQLKEKIYTIFVRAASEQEEIILHLRQKLLLVDILRALERGAKTLNQGFSEEVLAEEIRKTLPIIGQLTGEISDDEILEDIFNRFCIGK